MSETPVFARSLGSDWVLGIDLGSASLGWAAISLDSLGMASGLKVAGVRLFDPAVSGDIEKGQDESNAVVRRTARLIRRQLRRRAARQSELFKLLQKHRLLPAYAGAETNGARQRHEVLNDFDKGLAKKLASDVDGRLAGADLPLYLLRKMALDAELTPFELGRVFYHLSQRRGYKSNRKEQAAKKDDAGKVKKDEDLGEVKRDIEILEKEIQLSGSRTLGEYFASFDPHTQKVRRRWTGRAMYEYEFGEIWKKQAGFHPDLLTEGLHREVKRLLFYQRPIKAQAHLIGGCELEEGERRASWATLEAQQFRLLQKLNDLEIILPGQTAGIRLDAEQRAVVLGLLETAADVTFDRIRKALKLDKNVGFNLQRGGESKLKGSLTNVHMFEVFGERWLAMTDEEKKQVVEDWRTIDKEESLIRRAIEYWKLDLGAARLLAKRTAPSGYCMYSRKAIRKLLPYMQEGLRFQEAVTVAFPDFQRLAGGIEHDRIPSVREVLKTLRNPAIERALTELRKVVNALIREHGKPAEIRIELARDLKKPRVERAKATTQNRDREKERDAVRKELKEVFGEGFRPSRADLEKALLYKECAGECPYTGKRFPFSSLFGENSPWQVDHIIPFSRMPDDSFQNKVLCWVEANQYKGNRTPFETYTEPGEYEAILSRVRNWKKPNVGKLKRFELRTTDEIEGFSSRQLNDTRYASKLACELVGTLYGGRDVMTEAGKRQAVFASSGMVTATLRRAWGLEAILRETAGSANGETKGKPRSDHRHHAIDAITIALSKPKMIAQLSRANERDPYWNRDGRRRFPKIEAPWLDFVPSIRPHIEGMLVSHRPEHRLTGALHKGTNYSRPETNGKFVHIRRPVNGLTASEIESIVDPAVQRAVMEKAALFGGTLQGWTPNAAKDDWPRLATKSGKQVPIKKVRVRKALKVFPVGDAPHRTRFVDHGADSIHHIAIFVTKDGRGRDKWISEIVRIFEANQRYQAWKKTGGPIAPLVYGSHSEDAAAEFLFFLMKKDTLELEVGGKRAVYLVTSFENDGRINLIPINASGKREDQKESKMVLRESLSSLSKRVPQKVHIDSIGRKWPVRDKTGDRP